MGYYVFQRNVGYTSYSSYTITVCLSTWHGLAFVHFYVGVCVCVFLFIPFFFWWRVGRGVGKIGTNPGTSKFSDSPKLVCFVLSVLSRDACSIRC